MFTRIRARAAKEVRDMLFSRMLQGVICRVRQSHRPCWLRQQERASFLSPWRRLVYALLLIYRLSLVCRDICVRLFGNLIEVQIISRIRCGRNFRGNYRAWLFFLDRLVDSIIATLFVSGT